MIRFPSTASALAVALAVLGLSWSGLGIAQEMRRSTLTTDQIKILELDGMSGWLRGRFSSGEWDALGPGELALESHFCGCADVPLKHYPYVVFVLRSPKGDLIARPEGHEAMVHFVALAVRREKQYCDPQSEASCYGAFAHPCDFTDFRYGPQLAQFFPTCKVE